jgi:hypothetical protein
MPVKFAQDPEAILDYTLDWSKLLVEGDVLAQTHFTPDSGLSVLSENFTDSLATCWLLGGIAGQTYNVTCHITTVGGRQDDRTFQIVVKEK